MTDHEKRNERIINYLDGNLNEQERKAFEDELASDEVLKKDVIFYQALIHSIKEKGNETLRKELATYQQKYKRDKSKNVIRWIGYTTIGLAASFLIIFQLVPQKPESLIPAQDQPPLYMDSLHYEEKETIDSVKTDSVK